MFMAIQMEEKIQIALILVLQTTLQDQTSRYCNCTFLPILEHYAIDMVMVYSLGFLKKKDSTWYIYSGISFSEILQPRNIKIKFCVLFILQVERVELKDVRLPVQLQRAMAAEAEAARKARAEVIAAEVRYFCHFFLFFKIGLKNWWFFAFDFRVNKKHPKL